MVQVETPVLDALSARSPRAVEDFAQRSGLSIAQTQAVLGTLELEGAAALRERSWVRTGARQPFMPSNGLSRWGFRAR